MGAMVKKSLQKGLKEEEKRWSADMFEGIGRFKAAVQGGFKPASAAGPQLVMPAGAERHDTLEVTSQDTKDCCFTCILTCHQFSCLQVLPILMFLKIMHSA